MKNKSVVHWICIIVIGFSPPPPLQLRTDAEKRTLLAESGLSWDSEDPKQAQRQSLGGGGLYDTGSLKAEPANKWKKARPAGEGPEAGRGELRRPQTLGQSNMLKRPGRNPPVGVTAPITHTAPSGLKGAGERRDTQTHGRPAGRERYTEGEIYADCRAERVYLES